MKSFDRHFSELESHRTTLKSIKNKKKIVELEEDQFEIRRKLIKNITMTMENVYIQAFL